MNKKTIQAENGNFNPCSRRKIRQLKEERIIQIINKFLEEEFEVDHPESFRQLISKQPWNWIAWII